MYVQDKFCGRSGTEGTSMCMCKKSLVVGRGLQVQVLECANQVLWSVMLPYLLRFRSLASTFGYDSFVFILDRSTPLGVDVVFVSSSTRCTVRQTIPALR